MYNWAWPLPAKQIVQKLAGDVRISVMQLGTGSVVADGCCMRPVYKLTATSIMRVAQEPRSASRQTWLR